MKVEINKIITNVKKCLEQNGYKDFDIAYTIINKSVEVAGNLLDSYAVAFNATGDRVKIDIEKNKITPISNKNYSLANDIFTKYKTDYEIGYMNMQTHYEVWTEIDNFFPRINNKLGMQLYLNYCYDNHIDKITIDNAIKLNVPNIMKFRQEIVDIGKEKYLLKDVKENTLYKIQALGEGYFRFEDGKAFYEDTLSENEYGNSILLTTTKGKESMSIKELYDHFMEMLRRFFRWI